MAKKRSPRFTVEGKTIDQLMKTGSTKLHQLTTKNLKAIVTRLNSAGNKRMRRLEKSGYTTSPAYKRVVESGGDFTVKGITTREALENAFLRVKAFLTDETSTHAGYEKSLKRIERELKEKQKKGAEEGTYWKEQGATPDTGWTETAEDTGEEEDYSAWEDEDLDPWEDVSLYDRPVTSFFNAQDEQNRGLDIDKLWDVVDDLVALDPMYASRGERYGVFNHLLEIKMGKNAWDKSLLGDVMSGEEGAIEMLLDRIDELEREKEREYKDRLGGVSFDVGEDFID